MCSISGELSWTRPVPVRPEMALCMARRGPDASGTAVLERGVFYHNRLSVMDPAGGAQPMTVTVRGRRYTIVYNGELYNVPELRALLASHGVKMRTDCDTEAAVLCYALFGERCPELFNGIFAFCVYDEAEDRVFFARDRAGVKPFFYAQRDGAFLFASELKGLLASGLVRPELTREGLWQLLFLSPVREPGTGVFRDVYELLPGQCGVFGKDGLTLRTYWKLEAEEFSLSAAEAASDVRELLADAVSRQLVSDVPLACLLSGGLDSTVVSALAQDALTKQGGKMDTYSFEYQDNRQYFRRSLFQPQGDEDFAAYAAAYLGTAHTVLTEPVEAVAACLTDAVLARDMPGQADIDSSLLWFFRQIKPRHTVVLSGECADEIFGGYPWFYRPEMLQSDFFPWVHAPMARAELFDPGLVRPELGLDYARTLFRDCVRSCPTLPGDSETMKTARAANLLSMRYFMASLLERKDRMSMYSSVEVRVPFADHRLMEYVFNVPWEYRFENGVEKSLLRHAMSDLLPPRVLTRKKSPYPKTHHPRYTELVTILLRQRLEKDGFLRRALLPDRLDALTDGADTTWFGQLMGTPQLLAWLVQLDVWFEQYKVTLV